MTKVAVPTDDVARVSWAKLFQMSEVEHKRETKVRKNKEAYQIGAGERLPVRSRALLRLHKLNDLTPHPHDLDRAFVEECTHGCCCD